MIGTAISHYLSVDGSYFGESYDIRIWTTVWKSPWENVDEGVGNCGVCDWVCCVSVVWVWDGCGMGWGVILLVKFESNHYLNKPMPLTHWGWVTHICVSKLTIIGSDNGLSPGRRQAIIWANAGILLIRNLGTNFSEILSEIRAFSFKKIHLKMSSGEWRPFCLGLNVLKPLIVQTVSLSRLQMHWLLVWPGN